MDYGYSPRLIDELYLDEVTMLDKYAAANPSPRALIAGIAQVLGVEFIRPVRPEDLPQLPPEWEE